MKRITIILLLLVGTICAESYKVHDVMAFKSVLKKVKPGDQIILANGEWKDSRLIFEAEGTKDQLITLKAETAGKVILTGSSTLKIAGNYLVVDGLYFTNGFVENNDVIEFRKDSKTGSNFCRLTNTAIIDYAPADDKLQNKWVSLYGSHNRVDHCYFKNKSNEGCLLVVWLSKTPNYHLIDSNYFAYRPELGRNGAEIIRVGTSDWSMFPSYTTVENNYFENCNGEREIISNKSLYNTYRYNTFYECQGTLTLRHGNYCEVYGNYFFGNNEKNTGGVRIIGEGHKIYNNYFQDLAGEDAFAALSFMNGVPNSPANRYFQVKDVHVTFNTFVNNKQSIDIGVGKDEELSLPPINSIIANNILYSKNGKLIKYSDKPKNFKWEGNIYYGSEIGIDVKEGMNELNPEMKYDGVLYRPSFKNDILGKAIGDFNYVIDDIDGQARSNIKTPGCDELSQDKIDRKPMGKNNTGPNWKRN